MTHQLIAAAFSSDILDLPDEIVYLPEGEHKITPTVNGKPGAVTVHVPPGRGPAIAAALQSNLEKRLAETVRPHIDFDHQGRGPAAGLPKAFRYQPGQGIMLALDWTSAGRSAVQGRDFSYFSPEFLLGDDGTPEALPSRGPIGSLVNSPAFREIPRIAAADVGSADHVAALDAVMESDPAAYEAYLATLAREGESGQTVSAAERQAAAERIDQRALQLVAAGESSTLTGALEVACQENADDFSKAYLGTRSMPATAAETPAKAATAELESRARTLVAAGDAASYDDAIVAAINERPELYRKSFG